MWNKSPTTLLSGDLKREGKTSQAEMFNCPSKQIIPCIVHINLILLLSKGGTAEVSGWRSPSEIPLGGHLLQKPSPFYWQVHYRERGVWDVLVSLHQNTIFLFLAECCSFQENVTQIRQYGVGFWILQTLSSGQMVIKRIWRSVVR